VHAIVSRGGRTRDWQWLGLAYVDESAAELLYHHKVMRLLREVQADYPVHDCETIAEAEAYLDGE